MNKKIDDKEQIRKDRKTIERKIFLKNVYKDFYSRVIPQNIPNGPIVEIGSGAGFLKEINPKIVATDVVKDKNIDKVFHAEKIPFKNKSIAAFLMINVFHHIKNPKKAIEEMQRCLKNKGKIIMVEPYPSPFGKFIYKYLHRENCNLRAGWKIKGKGRMSDANSALPWIIFIRDRNKFKKRFPKLTISKIDLHTPFSYLISGGLTKIQFLPNSMYRNVKKSEQKLKNLFPLIAMFMTVEIAKQ